MDQKIYGVFFLCAGNSTRSILAEAILNQTGGGRFKAYSTGSFPKGEAHPAALKLPRRQQYAANQLRPKSWNDFTSIDAPNIDFVFRVCDNAAAKSCLVGTAGGCPLGLR